MGVRLLVCAMIIVAEMMAKWYIEREMARIAQLHAVRSVNP